MLFIQNLNLFNSNISDDLTTYRAAIHTFDNIAVRKMDELLDEDKRRL